MQLFVQILCKLAIHRYENLDFLKYDVSLAVIARLENTRLTKELARRASLSDRYHLSHSLPKPCPTTPSPLVVQQLETRGLIGKVLRIPMHFSRSMYNELFLTAKSCSKEDLVRNKCCKAFSASRSFPRSDSTVSLISQTSETSLCVCAWMYVAG